MKMELPIRAPRDGVVRAVHCAEGELVQPGDVLLEIEIGLDSSHVVDHGLRSRSARRPAERGGTDPDGRQDRVRRSR